MPWIKHPRNNGLASGSNVIIPFLSETLELGNRELEKQDVIDSGDLTTSVSEGGGRI
jgi:hypothetical protein